MAGSTGKDSEKMTRTHHSDLIEEFEGLTTDLDGILGLLEKTLGSDFEAKRLLCDLFTVKLQNITVAIKLSF